MKHFIIILWASLVDLGFVNLLSGRMYKLTNLTDIS